MADPAARTPRGEGVMFLRIVANRAKAK